MLLRLDCLMNLLFILSHITNLQGREPYLRDIVKKNQMLACVLTSTDQFLSNRPDCIVHNPVQNQSRNHDRCLEIPSYNTKQYKQSFFQRTIITWNKLNISIVQASSPLEAFKSALAVARRRWGAPTPRTQPRRNLRQTTDITMQR